MLVAGASGVGKTSVAPRIEQRLGLPHTEIDALFHGPNWTMLPGFVESVEAFSAEERWVTEWQYATQLGDLLTSRADTLVLLDYSVATHMSRLVRRTLRRRLWRIELWNGNVEPPCTRSSPTQSTSSAGVEGPREGSAANGCGGAGLADPPRGPAAVAGRDG